MPRVKVYKNNADPVKVAASANAFKQAIPVEDGFVGTDADWVEEVMTRQLKDFVRTGKRLLDIAASTPIDVDDII